MTNWMLTNALQCIAMVKRNLYPGSTQSSQVPHLTYFWKWVGEPDCAQSSLQTDPKVKSIPIFCFVSTTGYDTKTLLEIV